MMSSRRNWPAVLALLIIISLIISFLYVDFRLKASILAIAKSRAQAAQSERISQIVNEQVVAQFDYHDIVEVHKDHQGRIVLIQPNTIILNQMMTNTVKEVSASLRDMEEQSLHIPLGEVTGSKLLAGYGPRMKVRIIPVGQVHVSVQNQFDQAGINQTRHLIYFNIENTMKVAVPFMDEEIKVSAVVPLAETIIVGTVPDTYVGWNGTNAELLYPLLQRERMDSR